MSPQTLSVNEPREFPRLVMESCAVDGIACELPTICQPASGQATQEARWHATMVNISLGGVCLRLSRRFEKGTGLAIELPATRDQPASTVFVKVVHVMASRPGVWLLGCKFLSELSEDHLESLLSAGQPRYLTGVQLVIETRAGKRLRTVIKRLNATDCWPLAAGKILHLTGKTPDQSPWNACIRITHFADYANCCELHGKSV